jgi:hypothetical protein
MFMNLQIKGDKFMTNSERRFLERGNSASSTPPTDLAMHRQRAGLVEALRRNDPTRQSQEAGEQSSHGDKPHSLRGHP